MQHSCSPHDGWRGGASPWHIRTEWWANEALPDAESRIEDRGTRASVGHGIDHHGVQDRTMTSTMSLQVTYKAGQPLAAYLYLGSNGKREAVRSEERGSEFVVDYSAADEPLGIEILSPQSVTVEAVWRLCDDLGIERPSADELRPLSAA